MNMYPNSGLAPPNYGYGLGIPQNNTGLAPPQTDYYTSQPGSGGFDASSIAAPSLSFSGPPPMTGMGMSVPPMQTQGMAGLLPPQPTMAPTSPTMMMMQPQQPPQPQQRQQQYGYQQQQGMPMQGMQGMQGTQGMPGGVMGSAAQMAGMMATGQVPQQPKGQLYEIQFGAMKLDKKDLLSKSDPFLLLKASTTPRPSEGPSQVLAHATYKTNPFKMKHDPLSGGPTHHETGWVIAYRTETIMNDQNPTWKPFTIDTSILCHNNIDQPFLIEVYDWNRSGSHDFIGSAKTTLRELMTMREVRLTNNSRIGFSNTSGIVTLQKCLPIASGPTAGQLRPTGQMQLQQQPMGQQQQGLPSAPPASAFASGVGAGLGSAAAGWIAPMM